MTAKRKPMRARSARPKPSKQALLPEPTDNQMLEAMAAFERSRVRHVLMRSGDSFVVNVTPEQFGAEPARRIPPPVFGTEADARRWREHEIIREAITAGMRAKP
ncbi:hypothetical protein ABIB86_000463 [Bradyrhizobium sp. JR1.7]|uniref:hypothetical protein n=1 Tax=unclassified Bradyrhizobium TaxID=2631580 RepID=UPI0033964235